MKQPLLSLVNINKYFGDFHVLKDISFDIEQGEFLTLLGPSGCGKTTLLRCIAGLESIHSGDILLNGSSIKDMAPNKRNVNTVFQNYALFPHLNVYDNIAYGPRIHGIKRRSALDEIVEESLTGAALWPEVKDRLKENALSLSGGQQQRLCIARALAVEPEIILLDESTSALDPASTLKIEDLMTELKQKYTIIMVTHNMQQAARVSDKTAFFNIAGTGKPGKLIEYDDTAKIFSNPTQKATEDYVSGRFG